MSLENLFQKVGVGRGANKMAYQLNVLVSLTDDERLGPSTMPGGLQSPLIPVPDKLTPSVDLHRYLY